MPTTRSKPPTRTGSLLRWLSLALLPLTMIGCAASLPPMPVVVAPITIPSPPQVTAPLPSGSYWQKHFDLTMKRCLLGQKVQTLLSQTVTPCEPSLLLGPSKKP